MGDLPPYGADFLKNYKQIGWKTSWNGNRLRLNGAFFREGLAGPPVRVPRREQPDAHRERGRGAGVKGFESELAAWAVNGSAHARRPG